MFGRSISTPCRFPCAKELTSCCPCLLQGDRALAAFEVVCPAQLQATTVTYNIAIAACHSAPGEVRLCEQQGFGQAHLRLRAHARCRRCCMHGRKCIWSRHRPDCHRAFLGRPHGSSLIRVMP